MSAERNFKRSKDGIHWSKITRNRMKHDAWKQLPYSGYILVDAVDAGIETSFGNGYTYGRITNPDEVAGK